MADTYTTELALVKPEPSASIDTWGTKWNANMGVIDDILAEVKNLLESAVAPGAVMPFATEEPPAGWLEMDGSYVNKADHPALYAKIGGRYGETEDTFKLPDARGRFLEGREGDFDIGSNRESSILKHKHTATLVTTGDHAHSGTATSAGSHQHGGVANSAGNHYHTGSTNHTGDHTHSINSITSFGGSRHLWPGPVSRWKNTSTAGNHSHSISLHSGGHHSHGGLHVDGSGTHSHSLTTSNNGVHSHDLTLDPAGINESRPKNIALLICIKT